METILFHVDVNSAFLSWSAVKRLREDPNGVDLRQIPSAVGGDVKTRHGIITSRSIPAKAFGVATGEPVVKALQKCPQMVLVPSDFNYYRECSRAFMAILREYTDRVEQASVDEAYLDVGELCAGRTKDERRRSAAELAAGIRDRVRTELGFTVNVGVSSNRLLCKMASDFQKPDRTHELWPEEVEEKLWPLPIGRLYGCGPRTAEKLMAHDIRTIGDAARLSPDSLQQMLGQSAGAYIFAAANGRGGSGIHTEREAAKSYSNELTTREDITAANFEEMALPLLARLSRKVAERMEKDGVSGRTVTVSVKTADFRRRSRQGQLSHASRAEQEIYSQALTLLRQLLFGGEGRSGVFQSAEGIRLLGVGVSALEEDGAGQMTMEEYMAWAEAERSAAEKRARVTAALEKIRGKYGDDAISLGAPQRDGSR